MRKGQRQTFDVGTEADIAHSVSFDLSPPRVCLWGEQTSHDAFPKQGQG